MYMYEFKLTRGSDTMETHVSQLPPEGTELVPPVVPVNLVGIGGKLSITEFTYGFTELQLDTSSKL